MTSQYGMHRYDHVAYLMGLYCRPILDISTDTYQIIGAKGWEFDSVASVLPWKLSINSVQTLRSFITNPAHSESHLS